MGKEHLVTEIDKKNVQLLANGYRAQDIADERGVALKTVEVQIVNVRRKFGYKSAAHLVAEFMRKKIIQ